MHLVTITIFVLIWGNDSGAIWYLLKKIYVDLNDILAKKCSIKKIIYKIFSLPFKKSQSL